MNAGEYIYDLLFEYDCVIIPGFGGIIGNHTPARIHNVYHTFLPPSKSLLFNVNLKQNDGLLAFRIASEEKISYSEALHSLESTVSAWKRELNSGRSVDIGRVGRLYKDKEGNTQFEQNEETNFLADSYGLTSFISPVISRRDAGMKPVRAVAGVSREKHSGRRMIPRAIKWAAILALPIGTAAILGISNFEKIKTLSVAYSGLLIPNASPGPAVKVHSIKSGLPVSGRKPVERILAQPVKKDVQAERKIIQTGQQKPYAIIVGAFRFLENAEGLVADLRSKGYDASMAGETKTGLHRVSINTFASKEEAFRQLELVRSNEFASAWILVK